MPLDDTSSLPDDLRSTHERALRTRALSPIATTSEIVEDGGIPFELRIVDSLRRKSAAASAASVEAPVDPFLPPDPALFVAEVSDTHTCVLNRYPVLDRHLLVITRAFVHQDVLLDETDLDALWRCLAQVDGLGFYNGGVVAGASQPHMHLQLAPYPLSPDEPRPPIEMVLHGARFDGVLGRVPSLPFEHALARLDPSSEPPSASELLQTYTVLLAAVGRGPLHGSDPPRQDGPYNLLMTREWMMAVPRSREHFHGISINAIGFAGGLLVRDDDELAAVRRAGPLAVLRHVSLAPRRRP